MRDSAEVNTLPDDGGYIVVKVKPTTNTEKLGILRIFPGFHPYGPCQGYENPVFTLRSGTVTYVGDLSYYYDGSQLRFSISSNVEKARAYLTSKYSSVGPFEFHPMELLTVMGGACHQNGLMAPILIPAMRR